MENTFVVNDEPITIKITIEVIPGMKKEEKIDIKDFTIPHKEPATPQGWKEVEPTPIVDPSPVVKPEKPEMGLEPIVSPEKKKRAYTRKAKTTEEVAKAEPVEEKPVGAPVEEKKPEPVVNKPTVTPSNPNKVVARIAQMIRFYCKASGIETSTITIAQLKEKAFDIVENVSDDVIDEAY